MSEPESSTPSSSSSKNEAKKPPHCGRCRNHGIKSILKDHKKHCRFRDCVCNSCILSVIRRDIMAKQNALLKEMRTDDSSTGSASSIAGDLSPGRRRAGDCPPAASSFSSIEIAGSFLEDKNFAANSLIKEYKLELNELPFAYAVLSVAGDLNDAHAIIQDARAMLASYDVNFSYRDIPHLTESQESALSLVRPRSTGPSRYSSGDESQSSQDQEVIID